MSVILQSVGDWNIYQTVKTDLITSQIRTLNPGLKKSRIRETKNLSTDADSRTDTVLESLHDLSKKKNKIK